MSAAAPGHALPEWARQLITIIVAAGSAYMGIRLDLATMAANVVALRETAARHEAQIERIRENAEKIRRFSEQ